MKIREIRIERNFFYYKKKICSLWDKCIWKQNFFDPQTPHFVWHSLGPLLITGSHVASFCSVVSGHISAMWTPEGDQLPLVRCISISLLSQTIHALPITNCVILVVSPNRSVLICKWNNNAYLTSVDKWGDQVKCCAQSAQ